MSVEGDMTTAVSGARPPHCPECGGAPIGMVIRGVYDGVLFWKCSSCLHAWLREAHRGTHRGVIADSYIDACNIGVTERG